MDKKIKNLIFDWGNVIINLDVPRCVKAFQSIGFPLSNVGDIGELYEKVPILKKLEYGELDNHAFCDAVRSYLPNEVNDEVILEKWNSLLDDIPAYKLMKLVELHKHYRIFLLSNTSEIHWTRQLHKFRCGEYDLNDYFDRVFLSYQMKLLKPDKAIFEQVLLETQTKPEETLFIDDSPANCNAAKELGFHTYCAAAGEDWRPLFDK